MTVLSSCRWRLRRGRVWITTFVITIRSEASASSRCVTTFKPATVPARIFHVDSRLRVPPWREALMPEAGRADRAKCGMRQRGDWGLEMTPEV